ncbi:hypothetical protein J6590_041221, partial [Homalodisca vitripennis]
MAGLEVILLSLIVIPMVRADYGQVASIRHMRSRSHLTRPSHQQDRPNEPFVLDLTSTSQETTEGALLGLQSGEDARHHPKDDAEDFLEPSVPPDPIGGMVDIVTRFLRIVESQQQLGENCTAGTGLNLGEGVVDRYAQ